MTPEEKAEEVKRVSAALADFFSPAEHKWKPAVVSGNRAMALCFVDARVIQDRLDDVVGVVGWQDAYEIVANAQGPESVVCTLSLLIAGEWVKKMDVGSVSEQPDGGDRLKAAFSDALKRAAVKFGIGRYLYRLPAQWVDYDKEKRQFAKPPKLPDFVTQADPPSAAGVSSATPGGRKTAPTEAPVSAEQTAQDRKDLEAAVKLGSHALASTWKALGGARQLPLTAFKETLKAKAQEVDRATPA